MGIEVQILEARIAFAHGLWTASAIEEGQAKKFGADFIFEERTKVFKIVRDADTLQIVSKIPTTMDNILAEAAAQTWKTNAQGMLASLEASKKCYRDGNLRRTKSGDIYEGYEGRWFVAAKNKKQPTILDNKKDPQTRKAAKLTESDGRIYSGCYVNAVIEAYGMSEPKKKGVHASLKSVQFWGDGESFGGGGSVGTADDYDSLDVPAGADEFG